jgi:hypothetical protein
MVSDADWQWGISNIGAGKLLIWLEPWAEEFDIESRSTATLRVSNPACNDRCLDVETTNNHIVVWASGGDTVEVHIDRIPQSSSSAVTPVPGEFGDSTKELLNIMFGRQPIARLAGQQFEQQAPVSFWGRLKGRLGLS